MVDLKQVWFTLLVQQDVEAQDLEAHHVFKIAGLAGAVVVGQFWLGRDQGLYHQIFNLSHHFVDVVVLLPEPLQYFAERALVRSLIVD